MLQTWLFTLWQRLNTYLVSWLCMLEDLWEKFSIAFTTTCAGIHFSNFPDVTRMTGSQTLHKLEPHSMWGCVASVINFQEVIGGISTCSFIIICIAVALRDHNWNQRSIVGVLIDIYVSIYREKMPFQRVYNLNVQIKKIAASISQRVKRKKYRKIKI